MSADGSDPEGPEAKVMELDKTAIERALPLVSVGLEKYCRLQAALAATDVARDRTFQTGFNGFYRVRRNTEWQAAFYTLLQEEKSASRPFAEVLRALYTATGSVEASYASKLAASVDPGKPVIDSFVMKNVSLRLPRYGAVEPRLARIIVVYDRLVRILSDYLDSDMGRYLVTRFEESYPNRRLTRVKMLDLVLWQTR
jgi:hypothetical protein